MEYTGNTVIVKIVEFTVVKYVLTVTELLTEPYGLFQSTCFVFKCVFCNIKIIENEGGNSI
jgi:hypothetical protein